MKAARFMVIRVKDTEVVCFSNDIGAVLDYVAAQNVNEDTEYVIYEKLGRDDTPVRY